MQQKSRKLRHSSRRTQRLRQHRQREAAAREALARARHGWRRRVKSY